MKADGEFYLVTIGYDELKIRSYFVTEVTDEQLKKIVSDNNISLCYFEK